MFSFAAALLRRCSSNSLGRRGSSGGGAHVCRTIAASAARVASDAHARFTPEHCARSAASRNDNHDSFTSVGTHVGGRPPAISARVLCELRESRLSASSPQNISARRGNDRTKTGNQHIVYGACA